MNLTIFNLDKMSNWQGALPEITVLVFAVAVILLDLFINRKSVLAIVSVIGLLVSAFFSWNFWGANLYFFNDMLEVDSFSVFFEFSSPASRY